MKDTPIFSEQHSDEIIEIITRPPHWLTRAGTYLFLILLCFGLLGAWHIRYPEVVKTTFFLTALEAPRTIIVKTEGKAIKVLVRDGEVVDKDQPIAYLESSANHNEVTSLQTHIEQIEQIVVDNHWSEIPKISTPPFKELGELQLDYENFCQVISQLIAAVEGGYNEKKRDLLINDQKSLVDMHSLISEQLELQLKDFKLASEEFSLQERLYNEKVIANLEFKREASKLIAKEMPIKQLKASLLQNESSQIAKKKELLEIENIVRIQKSGFLNSLHTLKSKTIDWKRRFIISAPVAGKLAFLLPFSEQQHIKIGQELAVIEPEASYYHGIIKIPQNNIGKLDTGQRVLLKLDGFPYKEFGILEGRLSQISSSPGKDSVYWANVRLPQGLTTVHKKMIKYRNGLRGNAEIVTKEKSLAERLVNLLPTN